jgi:rhodanese-related sulfurtransferase
MALKRISPAEAQALLEQEGYVFLDVRSVPEFEAGHPKGAYNIPLMHRTWRGMQPNAQFLKEVRATFALEAKIVIGCKAGGRSMRAAMVMMEAGYTNVVDQRAGFSGVGMEAGWVAAGLPTSKMAEPGRDHASLKKQANNR